MPRNKVAPDSESMRLGLVDLAALVGEPGFPDALVGLLRRMADVEHVLVLAFADGRPVPILAASADRLALIETVSRRFVEDYSTIDPLLPAVRGAADSPVPRLFRAELHSMPHR